MIAATGTYTTLRHNLRGRSPRFIATQRSAQFQREAARRVLAGYDTKLARLKAESPCQGAYYYASLVPSWIGREPNAEPNALKYLRDGEAHINKWPKHFLRYMTSVKKGYELGVGPGFLLRYLIDVEGADMRGCDLDPAKNLIFRDLRDELGLAHRVDVHAVKSGQPIPVPEGCDSVFGFWTVFTETWSLSDHAWFLDHCREHLIGEKRVFMLFNSRGYDDHPEIQDYYIRRGAEFPYLANPAANMHPRDRNAFCILRL